jgi:hypothetical protein
MQPFQFDVVLPGEYVGSAEDESDTDLDSVDIIPSGLPVRSASISVHD